MELREGDGFDACAVDDVSGRGVGVEAPEIPIREWPNHSLKTSKEKKNGNKACLFHLLFALILMCFLKSTTVIFTC